ncbi:MAG: YHYH protein [Myxococcales bacterium]|nr:MAG: YHYH protein [Myxococcales bacterium]
MRRHLKQRFGMATMLVGLIGFSACGDSKSPIAGSDGGLNDASANDDSDTTVVDCDDVGTVSTATPTPQSSSDTSNFNVQPLACELTSAALGCSIGTQHQYLESISGNKRLITANGIPNHDVGEFPNNDNPNTIAAQSYNFEVPVSPSGKGEDSELTFGIAISGVVFEPGTAEMWRDNPDWRYEALRYADAPDYFQVNGGSDTTMHPNGLGVDCNFAHVQPDGSYHYHGIPTGLLPSSPALTFVGWAADGYPVFAKWGYEDANDVQSNLIELKSSYALKNGTRPSGSSGPGGSYDGTFVQDWQYAEDSGDLDECNGRTGVVSVNGEQMTTYHYYLTETFPYIPRCYHASPDDSFAPDPGGNNTGQLPSCPPGQTSMCCGDGYCAGPETPMNCSADC